jgi:hypothetical protein
VTEAFLIDVLRSAPLPAEHGVDFSGLGESLVQALSARCGAPPERIEGVYWGGEAAGELEGIIRPDGFAWVHVTRSWDAGHAALQAAAQAILAGDAHLVVAASCIRGGDALKPEGAWQELAAPVKLGKNIQAHGETGMLFIGGTLLASAQAVGRYNLSPRAALIGRLFAATGTQGIKALRSLLKGAEIDPGDLAIILASPDAPAGWIASLEVDAARINPFGLPPAGERHAAVLLAGLTAALERDGSRFGLLVNFSTQGAWLATLVERI